MKNKQSVTFRDMYKTMPIEVDYGLYKRILEEMCKVILEYVLDGSEGFKMPFGLGFIQIGKYKQKTTTDKLAVDYKASKEYGKRIYHLNEHSGGYKYRHLYRPDTCDSGWTDRNNRCEKTVNGTSCPSGSSPA